MWLRSRVPDTAVTMRGEYESASALAPPPLPGARSAETPEGSSQRLVRRSDTDPGHRLADVAWMLTSGERARTVAYASALDALSVAEGCMLHVVRDAREEYLPLLDATVVLHEFASFCLERLFANVPMNGSRALAMCHRVARLKQRFLEHRVDGLALDEARRQLWSCLDWVEDHATRRMVRAAYYGSARGEMWKFAAHAAAAAAEAQGDAQAYARERQAQERFLSRAFQSALTRAEKRTLRPGAWSRLQGVVVG